MFSVSFKFAIVAFNYSFSFTFDVSTTICGGRSTIIGIGAYRNGNNYGGGNGGGVGLNKY